MPNQQLPSSPDNRDIIDQARKDLQRYVAELKQKISHIQQQSLQAMQNAIHAAFGAHGQPISRGTLPQQTAGQPALPTPPVEPMLATNDPVLQAMQAAQQSVEAAMQAAQESIEAAEKALSNL